LKVAKPANRNVGERTLGAAVEVENLEYTYRDGTRALKGLSLTIPRGARVAVLGPNGAGKSTLLLHLNGIYLPQKGRVRVLGREVSPHTEDWVRTRVGLVFQDPDDQVFSSTVWEDVAFGPTNLGLSETETRARVEKSLAAVGMEDYGDRVPHHLSYGEKKRVAIAGILAMEPEVVVLDEPTAYLDPRGKESVLGIMEELHRRGKTLVVATHDVDLAAEWAEMVVVIKDGMVFAAGGTDLLVDEEVIRQADLALPRVARIFQQVSGLKTRACPKTVKEAVEYLENLTGHCDVR